MTRPSKTTAAPRTETELRLTLKYSPLIGGQELCRLLGYPSDAAFRQAAARNKLPVATVTIPGRRGRFARARDVAAYLDALDAEFDAAADEKRSRGECTEDSAASASPALAKPTQRPP